MSIANFGKFLTNLLSHKHKVQTHFLFTATWPDPYLYGLILICTTWPLFVDMTLICTAWSLLVRHDPYLYGFRIHRSYLQEGWISNFTNVQAIINPVHLTEQEQHWHGHLLLNVFAWWKKVYVYLQLINLTPWPISGSGR